jgi:hypothetical protein
MSYIAISLFKCDWCGSEDKRENAPGCPDVAPIGWQPVVFGILPESFIAENGVIRAKNPPVSAQSGAPTRCPS